MWREFIILLPVVNAHTSFEVVDVWFSHSWRLPSVKAVNVNEANKPGRRHHRQAGQLDSKRTRKMEQNGGDGEDEAGNMPLICKI